MKLVMTLLVRDEEDIVRTHIDYHLAQGVDFVIATNNRSVDQTRDILLDYQGRGLLHLIDELDDDYAQAKWVTRMARLAVDRYQADWVIHSDVDEFWLPQAAPDLKAAFREVSAEVEAIRVERSNFPPMPELPGDDRPFWKRMVIRERASLNAVGRPLPPKVCHRRIRGIEVVQGNHEVVRDGNPLSQPSDALQILHFPLRSCAQFENKIRNGGAAYQRNRELPREIGITWRRLYERYQSEGLQAYYAGETLSEPQATEGLRDGSLLFDFRLCDALRGRVADLPGVSTAGERSAAANAPEGIVTLVDGNYLEGLKLLHGSVQDSYPVPIHCFDLGLTESQRRWCGEHLPGVTIAPIPQTPVIEAIQAGLDGPPLAKREKRQWPLWICPFLIEASPFRRVFWLDCDIVVLRNLGQMFAMLDDGPVFTPENNAPEVTPNDKSLYDLLPIEREFDARLPTVNGGVSGWDLIRDRPALQAYMFPVRRALEDPAVRSAIAWHDQGCLIWAIQALGLENRVLPTWSWNLCVRHTAAAGSHYHWKPGVLEDLRGTVPEAQLLHWNGSTVPWRIGSGGPVEDCSGFQP